MRSLRSGCARHGPCAGPPSGRRLGRSRHRNQSRWPPWPRPPPGVSSPRRAGPSSRMLVASATKARLASSLTCRSSMEGWKAKSNCSKVLWRGKVGHLGPGGEIPLPASINLDAQQLFQHLVIGQLLAGGGVQDVVQDLHGLLESKILQVLAGLLQCDHPAPATAASSYTSRERSSTSPTGICTAIASRRRRLSPWGSPCHWPGKMKR